MKRRLAGKPVHWQWLLLLLIRPALSFTPLSHLQAQPRTSIRHDSTHRFCFRRKSTFLYAVKSKKTTIQHQKPSNDTIDNDDDESNNTGTLFGFPSDVASPLALLLLSQFILFIGVGAVIPSIPLYGKEIGLSGKLNGIVISAPALASLLGSKFAGNYADVARKPAMMIGMAIIVISDVATALATTLVTLTAARLGLGAGRIISESGERGMLADLAGKAPQLRGRALAAQQATIALGIAIGAPAGGVLVEQYGPRVSFLCVSAAAFFAFCMYFFLPETVVMDGDANENETRTLFGSTKTKANDSNTNEQDEQGEWASLLKQDKWKGLALCQIGASFGFAAKISSIPLLATATLPGGAIGAGALLSAAGLSGLIGAPIGGWLTDQTSAKSTIILSGLTSAAGLTLIPFALNSLTFGDETFTILGQAMSGQAAAFSLMVLVWSIGAAAQGPALTALAQELAPSGKEATAMALPRAAGDGTYIVAPFLLGLVSDMVISVPGLDCAVAGLVGFIGASALAFLDNGDGRKAPVSD